MRRSDEDRGTEVWAKKKKKKKAESVWTREENKMFESALVIFADNTPNRWDHVAAMIPGKSAADVMRQYKDLEDDVAHIEAGAFDDHRNSAQLGERKKGVPWTQEEHRRFLVGLMKYGKGDWRNISRNLVITKNPTQVASHAQKYFLRQSSKDKRSRPSIHDFTTRNLIPTHHSTSNSYPL